MRWILVGVALAASACGPVSISVPPEVTLAVTTTPQAQTSPSPSPDPNTSPSPTAAPSPAPPAAPAPPPAGACIPASSPIGFAGNAIYVDSASVRGGLIPVSASSSFAGQQIGTIGVEAASAVDPMSLNGATMLSRAAVDATVTMWTTAGDSSGKLNVVGTIQINPTSLTEMAAVTQGGSCVSGVAFDVGRFGTTLYGGRVYLYLNQGAQSWSFPL